MNEELYGLKSRFHMHGCFLRRDVAFIAASLALSTLDERLSTDGLRFTPVENESRD